MLLGVTQTLFIQALIQNILFVDKQQQFHSVVDVNSGWY